MTATISEYDKLEQDMKDIIDNHKEIPWEEKQELKIDISSYFSKKKQNTQTRVGLMGE